MKLLALGMTAGALALSTLGAQAQTATPGATTSTPGTTDGGAMAGSAMGSGSTTGGATGSGAMAGGAMANGSMKGGAMAGDSSMMGQGMMGGMMAPTPVSGTVTRYYVDRAGFVAAMDVQTTDGTRLVRFSPSMAQRLTSSFPVGSTISGFVTSSGTGAKTDYELAGTGTSMPAPGMMMSTPTNDIDILRAPAYTTLGAKETDVTGTLTGFISDPTSGDVLALIVNKSTLVRVPQQSRLQQASTAPEGVSDLLTGALVVARGVDEAPRYGTVSPYSRRLIANSIAVDGRNVGTFGFGRVKTSAKNTLLKFDLFGGVTPKNLGSTDTGLQPYMAPGSDSSMSGGAMAGMGADSTGAAMGAGMGTGTPSTGAMGTGSATGSAGTGTGAMAQ